MPMPVPILARPVIVPLLHEPSGDGRQRNYVGGTHADRHDDVEEIHLPQHVDAGHQHVPQAEAESSDDEGQPWAMPVNGGAGGEVHEADDEKSDRGCSRDLFASPSELADEGIEEQTEAAVDAPEDGLNQKAERRDDVAVEQPWTRSAVTQWSVLRSRARTPSPQSPVSPSHHSGWDACHSAFSRR